MEFNECQKEIIYYIIEYDKNPEEKLIPCIDVFEQIFQEKYTNLEIEENTRALISSGILTPYSFHSYLRLTETFISSKDYMLFKEQKN